MSLPAAEARLTSSKSEQKTRLTLHAKSGVEVARLDLFRITALQLARDLITGALADVDPRKEPGEGDQSNTGTKEAA